MPHLIGSRILGAAVAALLAASTLTATAWAATGAPDKGTLPSPLSAAEKKLYGEAVNAAERGAIARARSLAGPGARDLPRKVIDWLDMTRRGTQQPFEKIAAFIDANPHWPYQFSLRRRAEEAMAETTPDDRVLAFFHRYPPLTTDGRVRLVAALMATGDQDRAVALLRETWRTDSFRSSEERRFYGSYRKFLTKADHEVRLDNSVWAGRLSQAHRALPHVDRDLQLLAKARIALRAYRGNVDWHVNRVPKSLRNDPGLLYERARWRRRKGRIEDAYELLRNVPPTAPNAELWWTERSIVARGLLAKGDISAAYRLSKNNGLKEGLEFVEAEWFAGWVALRFLQDAREALTHFERIHDYVSYPISKARAAYWAGRAAEKLGDTAKAADYFRRASRHTTTYYGQLAAARVDASAELHDTPIAPTKAERAAFARDDRVAAVRFLDDIGADDLVQVFVDDLGGEAEPEAYRLLAARLAVEIGRSDLAVRVARKGYQLGTLMPDLAYPVMEMPDGRPERALLLAITRQESNFDYRAISPAGARGLMQLMPRTARHVARHIRERYSRARLTQDPEYNIRLGRAYLGEMLEKFDSSYILAVAAYNAGPHAVARWIRELGDPREKEVDVIDWIESIPYGETRNYVQRVMENLQVYRARLDGTLVAEALVEDLER